MKIIKKFKWLFLILIVAALAGWYFLGQKNKTQVYETTQPSYTTLISSISSSGNVVAKKEATLHFQTLGRLTWVGIKEGDWVNQWQAIAALDQRGVQKELTKALRDYSKERNDFEEDRVDTYRYIALNDTIKRILEKNQWDLEKAILDVELKTIALEYATLVTPIAGIVTRLDAQFAGVNITPTTEFTITDPSSIVFQAEVDETDIGQIQPGQQVTITLDSYPDDVFTGTVDFIGFTAVTSSSGGTSFLVDIVLPDNSGLRFKPGMNGDADIILTQKENTLTVPYESVFTQDGKSYVWIYNAGKPIKAEVTTGIEGELEYEIIKGLATNETIVKNANDINESP